MDIKTFEKDYKDINIPTKYLFSLTEILDIYDLYINMQSLNVKKFNYFYSKMTSHDLKILFSLTPFFKQEIKMYGRSNFYVELPLLFGELELSKYHLILLFDYLNSDEIIKYFSKLDSIINNKKDITKAELVQIIDLKLAIIFDYCKKNVSIEIYNNYIKNISRRYGLNFNNNNVEKFIESFEFSFDSDYMNSQILVFLQEDGKEIW